MVWPEACCCQRYQHKNVRHAFSQHHLVALISSLNMDVMNVPRLTIPGHLQQVDEHGKLTLTSSKRYLERQATAFINFIQKRLQQHE